VPTPAACKLLDLKRAEGAGSELGCPYAGNAANCLTPVDCAAWETHIIRNVSAWFGQPH